MALLKVLFADDEIPDEKTLEEELKKPIHLKKYSLWKHKITLGNISKLTVANKYEDAIKLAKDKEQQFDIAIIDLHWNDYKENVDAGFEICEAIEETSQAFKIVYSSRLNENPELRKKIIDLNALPLHKSYKITSEKQIEKSCNQLKSVILFVEMLQDQDQQIKIGEKKDERKRESEKWQTAKKFLDNSIYYLEYSQHRQNWYIVIMYFLWISFVIYIFYQIAVFGWSVEIKAIVNAGVVLLGVICSKFLYSTQKQINDNLKQTRKLIQELIK